jgi:photosystem II stability/assembly factor-like uncharacterized protein
MEYRKQLWSLVVLATGMAVAIGPGSVQAHAASRHPVDLLSIHMINATTGWAATSRSVLRTTQGAKEWMDVTPRGVTLSPMSVEDFLTARLAWVAVTPHGSAIVSILHTVDGGRTWQRTSVALPSRGLGVQQIDFVDPLHGWLLVDLGVAAGSQGVAVLRSVDGGARWTTVSLTAGTRATPGSLPFSGDKTGITFRSTATGFATGTVAGPPGFAWLYVTHNAGHTWQHQRLPLPLAYQAAFRSSQPFVAPPRFFTPRDGILAVSFVLPGQKSATVFYITHDGGVTWSSTIPLLSTTTSFTWAFSDMRHGWATAGEGLYRTTDGGYHWTRMTPNVKLEGVTDLAFADPHTGWALGSVMQGQVSRAFLLQTVDGGATWTRVYPYVQF